MAILLSHLTAQAQQALLADLNYLNMREIRDFCQNHHIPFRIHIETDNGDIKPTNKTDRKGIILHRIRHFLKTGDILPPTCIKRTIIKMSGLAARPGVDDRLFYGCYNKKHEGMNRLLKQLSNGRFRDGAVARVLLMDFWTNGQAPTLKEFASVWLDKQDKGMKIDPEYAFLSDRAAGKAGWVWKKKRANKAKNVLQLLASIKKPAK